MFELINDIDTQLAQGKKVCLSKIREMLQEDWEKEEWDAILDLASKISSSGELVLALEIYKKAGGIIKWPTIRGRALLGEGIVSARKLEFEKATELMEEAAQIALEQRDYKQLISVRQNQLIMLYKQGKWRELALKASRWIWVEEELLPRLMLNSAQMMYDVKQYEEAITILGQGKELLYNDSPLELKMEWLEALTLNLRAAGDDYLSQAYCLQAIQLNYPQKKFEILDIPERRQQLSRLYDLLAQIYIEIDDNEPDLQPCSLFVAETMKDLNFSAPIRAGVLPPKLKTREDAIILQLVSMESKTEQSYRKKLETGLGGYMPCQVGQLTDNTIDGLVRQLSVLHTSENIDLIRFNSKFDQRVKEDLTSWWPSGCIGLAYRLDPQELVLNAYLVEPDANLRKFHFDINYAAINALLNICRNGISDELEFMANRLTEMLLPPSLRQALWETEASILLISADPKLEGVPWETLGTDGSYLGTDYDLAITPSLIRAAKQINSCSPVVIKPDLFTIIANPTQDLPFAEKEAQEIMKLLEDYELKTTKISKCKHEEFLSLAPTSKWIHYAGHANYLNSYPGVSYLHLYDHLLTAQEIASSNIAQDSVWILNACEMAQTGDGEGECGLGLSRVLLLKGACTVIGANWPTADEASADTLVEFYQRFIGERSTITRAMRDVRCALHRHGCPMYEWAQYSVIGHPNVIIGTGKNTWTY
ncbi:hypothetical protein MSKOL_0682 [Methanosarcina sp. Kolksee]|uniref:CHAT domain-containing protein n=1 Tax=Methanosarcina sp. Kolksee TaxID=1434099 RepID=UPI000615D5A8|nr:CHAT domain-containing protein [Methanosarcina sp. Kolksee]AKB46459.1 hypothetical protein MSKOL_0682 [Methanosarcina sp. Kolksee]